MAGTAGPETLHELRPVRCVCLGRGALVLSWMFAFA